MQDKPSSNSSADPSPSSTPSPPGSQSLIVGLILGVMALVLFLFILPKVSNNNAGGGSSEVAKLREELEARRKALSGTNEATNVNVSPRDLASRVATDSAKLSELVTQLQAAVGRLQNELKMSQTTVHSLSNQLAIRASESTANTGLRQQLDSALKRGDAAELELQSLRQQFAGAPTAAQMEALLKERDSLRSRLNSLSKPPSEPESVSAPEEPAP
jgi:chromosome segregation ATPase